MAVSLRRAAGPLLVLSSVLSSCREGEGQSDAQFVPIPASLLANQGCNGPAGSLAAPVPVYTNAALGPDSQLVAVAGEETLYFTGADASVHQLEFPGGGGAPTDTVLVAPGTVDALLSLASVPGPARLSGISVLDVANLVVIEHASNTLLLVNRILPDTVSFLAGLPGDGGFADGLGGQIRFDFVQATQVVATGSGLFFVADPGNHAVRLITLGALPLVETVAGTGAPFFAGGELANTGFDTPTGLSVSCGGELLVTETGESGAGGHRLRSLALVTRTVFFGGFEGSSLVLAGDGTEATVEGEGPAASLSGPNSPVTSTDGLVFWVDSGTGNLRRFDGATGLADCPLFPSCADAVAAGGSFTNGGGFSLAITGAGSLYVLDGDAATLYRVTP